MSTAKKVPAKKVPAKKTAPKAVAAKSTAKSPAKSPAKPVAKKAAAPKASAKSTPTKSASVKKAPLKNAVPAKKAAPKKAAAKAAPSKAAATKPAAPKAAAPKLPPKTTTTKALTSVRPDLKKNASKKPAFDEKFLEAQRLLLLEERATYTRQADNLQAEADSLAELREPGDVQFDEESGEGDTLAVERERDLALSARARYEVEEIDRALIKITQGTYGICEVSGLPIPRARLQAIPQCRERVEYKVGGFSRR